MSDCRYGIGKPGFHNAAVDTARRAEVFNQEAELSRYRAFVDELKMVADRASLWVTPEVITELINKHGLGEQE